MSRMTAHTVPIRVVEWNAALALHRKAHLLADLAPIVAILPEIAHPDKTKTALEAVGATKSPTSVQWIGANTNMGLSVVGFNGWDLRLDESYRWVFSVHVIGPRQIKLSALWDMHDQGKGHQFARGLGACRASLSHHSDFMDDVESRGFVSACHGK